jgi:hypothetical protein
MDFMDWFFLTALLILCAGRAFYFFVYYKKFWQAAGWSSKPAAALWATRAPAVALLPGALSVTDEQRASRHRRFFDTSERQVETLFLIGSVALAAWTQLFTGSAAGTPGANLSGFSRNLLLASAIILIATPGLFRSNGGQVTYMGRESVTIIGFGSLILALSSFIVDLFGIRGTVVGVALALILVIREMIHMRSPIKALKWLNTARPGSRTDERSCNTGTELPTSDYDKEHELENAELRLRPSGDPASGQYAEYAKHDNDGGKQPETKPPIQPDSDPQSEHIDQPLGDGRTTAIDDPSDPPED